MTPTIDRPRPLFTTSNLPGRNPGQIGGVRVLPAVLDRLDRFANPTLATRQDWAQPAVVRVANSARVWFVDAPDEIFAPLITAQERGPARLLVSPEFERRRKAVESELRRRARQPAVWGLMGLTVLLLGLLVSFSPWLSVRTVNVLGVDGPTSVIIRNNTGALQGQPLLRVDPRAIVRHLERSTDIASVRVSKVWPNKIVIQAVMRRPMAVLRRKGTSDQVIDDTGTRLISTAFESSALPVIHVDASDASTWTEKDTLRRVSEATTVVRSMGPTVRARLRQVDHFGDDFVLRVGSVSVHLGRAVDLDAKAAALASMVAAGQLDRAATIDVSVPDTAIVTAKLTAKPATRFTAKSKAKPTN